MRRNLALLTYLMCICFLCSFPLQGGQYVYSHFSTENGLPSNHIHDITQDKKGFIWIATHYGVSKFNGKSFHNYLSADYKTMFRDDMYHSFLMKDGTVGFASSKGTLVAYADHKDDFSDLAHNLGFYCDVTGYTQAADGEELIATSDGIYAFDAHGKTLVPTNVVAKGTPTFEIHKDHFQHYWVGLNQGAGVFSKDGKKLAGFEPLETIREQINNICQIDGHTLWLCASTGSLWQATLDASGGLKQFGKIDTPFKNISEICVDGPTVWIGTAGSGLWKTKIVGGKQTFERCMPINRDDSEVRKISALFRDADGNIWVGTQNSGIWRISPVINEDVAFSNDLGIPKVTGTSFAENSKGEILMGTDGQGLFVLDSLFNVKKHLTENDGLSSNNILSLQPDNGRLVVSYWGGPVSRLNANTLQNEKISYNGLEKPSYNGKFAAVDNGTIWTCLSGDGVYITTSTGTRRLELPLIGGTADKWTNHVLPSKSGGVWIATTRTVWRTDRNGQAKPLFADTEQKPNHNPLELNQCAEDPQGNCFLATSEGVYCCENGTDSFKKLDFLPNGIYCSILIDADGTIYTGGTNGIVSFSYKTGSFSTEIDGLERYDRNFFIPRAVFKDKRNRLFFGTKQGFVMLSTAVKPTAKQPFVEWSDLFLRGARVKTGDSDLLPTALPYMETLNLAYDQTDFSLKFDVVNFEHRNTITGYYQIGGLDTSWVPVGDDETIGITQLPPGNYDLRVRFFCKGVEVPNATLHMGLKVLPPWWRTWWFYTLCVLLLVISVSLYFFNRIRNITRQKIELEQKVAERTQELRDANLSLQQREKEVELQNDMLHSALKDKDQLVSVVAHDLKNPMFSIVGSLEDLLRDEKVKDNALLRQVYHASSVLQGQMLKLLDWATENRITATCDYQNIDLQEIVQEVVALTHGLLSDKQIKLSTNISVSHYVYADPRMLSTIVRNLLTNAVKFTEKGKCIDISACEVEGGKIRFSVKDQGVGMSEETVANLLSGRRTTRMGTEFEQGYGIGFGIIQEFVKLNNGQLAIESELGKGTSICVDLVCSDQVLVKKQSAKKAEKMMSVEVDKELLEGKTILVVDDDPLILLHMKSLLSKFVNVLTADNGADGLQLAKNTIPDLILSDVDMPKMGGMDMFDAIRGNSLTSNIPVLFISAINEESLRMRGLSRGAIDYIAKPFNEQELLLKACNVLSVLKKQQLSVLMDAMKGDVQKTDDVNPLLGQLLDVVKEHYQEAGFSFDDMASALGLSKSTLVRRLKSLTDKSPVEILSDYRLNKAKQLLLEGQASVSDVAYAVGFSDPLYFSRKFKEAFGCPPSKIK